MYIGQYDTRGLFGARTPATIMTTYAGRWVSGVPQPNAWNFIEFVTSFPHKTIDIAWFNATFYNM